MKTSVLQIMCLLLVSIIITSAYAKPSEAVTVKERAISTDRKSTRLNSSH